MGGIAAAVTAFAALGPAQAAQVAPYALNVAYSPSTNSATITWKSDAPLASKFVVERRMAGAPTWTEVAVLGEPRRSYTDTGLAPLTRYEYQVKSHRSGGAFGPLTVYTSATGSTRLDFPYGVGYGRGIVPTNFSQAQKDADVLAMYNAWRATYLTTQGAGEGGMRVRKNDATDETVSEGQGYGMIISVYMANSSNSGKEDFDKLLTYYKAKEHIINGDSSGLMSWKIRADGTVADVRSAPDGDIDAAFALLVADRKWGSDGKFNYKKEAQKTLAGLMKYVILNRGPNDSNLVFSGEKPNLTWRESSTDWTMASYQIVSYFKQFGLASDPVLREKWNKTRAAGYKAYDYFYKLNPATALTPYVYRTQPGPNQYTRTTTQGYTFSYDSCRTPWRVGLDYLWHGNEGSILAQAMYPNVDPIVAQNMPKVNAAFMNRATGGSDSGAIGHPMNAVQGYNLDGTPSNTFQNSQRSMVTPSITAAMTDPSNQEWLNSAYAWMRVQVPGKPYTGNGRTVQPTYFGDAVMMMNMLIITGNMPNLPEYGYIAP